MRRLTNPLAFAACLSLLSLQLSGVHVHADDNGYVGAPETPFSHSHDHHGHDGADHDNRAHNDSDGRATVDDHGDAGTAHDYEDAEDVAVIDPALGTFKVPLAVLTLFLLFAAIPPVGILASTGFVYRVLSGRHTRWRPPLRAPPQPA